MSYKKILSLILAGSFFLSTGSQVTAGEDPPKLVSLGLSAATAAASQKDVVKGLKQAAADEYTDWLWEAVGGTEKFMTGNGEAEIPAAKDKIMKIVSTVQAIEKFSIAVTEGRYDDAAMGAIDEAVGALNHPLVSVTWEMAKLTYESHKLVLSTGAARDIEALYGIVSNDRRLMGVVDPNADEPAQIPVNAKTADYFFNKYIVTNGSARGLLKSYVTTHLGQDWPEESWSDYMKSWMSVGSGVDTAEKVEIDMLAGQWRNKARGWIVQLLKEVNKQAKVAWGETRLRQQMAEFKKFSDRVGHFYNNDLDRMLSEFLAIKANKAAEAELAKLPEASQKACNELAFKISKMSDKDLKNASAWDMQINDWQLKCLSASSKMIGINEPLSQSLSAERKKWLELADKLHAAVKAKKGTVGQAVVKEAAPRPIPAGKNPTRDDLAQKRAQAMYKEYFEDFFEDFDWLTIEKEVEVSNSAGESEIVKIQADPQYLPQAVLEQLNIGDFGGAHAIIAFWKEDVRSEMRRHFAVISEKINDRVKTPPSPVASVIEEYHATHKMVRAKGEKVDAELQRITDQINSLPNLDEFLDPAWPHHEEFCELQEKSNSIRVKHQKWAREQYEDINKEYYIETTAIGLAAAIATDVLERTKAVYEIEHKDALSAMTETLSAFKGLANSLRQKVNQYEAECRAILEELPAPLPLEGNYWLMEDALAQVAEGSYTYMKAPKSTGAVKAADMVSFLSGMAPEGKELYLAEHLLSTAQDITTKAEAWEKAEQEYTKLGLVPEDEVVQARVLVDPDFDPAALRKEIEAAIQYARTIKKVVPKLERAAKKASRDELNRTMDADSVLENVRIISGYFSGLEEEGLIQRGAEDYEIVLPQRGRDGIVRIAEPFPHYATRAELAQFGKPVREAWTRMKAVSFARKNAPTHVAKWEEIMNLRDISAAEGENFIAPGYDLPLYKRDLEEAFQLASRVSGKSDGYRGIMEQIGELVPGLLHSVSTVVDKEHEEKQASLYGMSVEEYKEKTGKKDVKPRFYVLSEAARSALDSGELDHEPGKIYEKLANRIMKIDEEYKLFQQELNEREAQEEARRYQEGARRKMEAEGEKTVNAMDPYQLAGFYGYSMENSRLNSRSMQTVRGEVIMTKGDLAGGKINVSGRLFTIDKARAILLSEDNGRTWRELPVARDLNFSIDPLPNKRYELVLRIKTIDDREAWLKVFPGVDAIIYQDVAVEQLVAQTLKQVADAYEATDVFAFMDHVSRDYLGNKTILEEGVRFDFDMFTDIRLAIYINRIAQRGNMFVAETKWDKKQSPRQTGQEQLTSGRTTFMFVLEGGKMRIRNLRGDLIYATLSPEIAQASGKSPAVVDLIRIARDDRTPTQPGAGEIEDAGGVTSPSSALLMVKTATFTSSPGMTRQEYIDFETGATGEGMSGDIFFGGNTFFPSGTAQIDRRGSGLAAFNALDTVPDDFSDEGGGNADGGEVFVILTGEGNYVKMYISSVNQYINLVDPADPDYFDTTISYAIQLDGSTNLATQ